MWEWESDVNGNYVKILWKQDRMNSVVGIGKGQKATKGNVRENDCTGTGGMENVKTFRDIGPPCSHIGTMSCYGPVYCRA